MNQVRSLMWKLPAGWVLTLGAMVAGCTPSNSVPTGAPVMVSFGPVDPTMPNDAYGSPAYLPLADATTGGALTIPPRSAFIATFDRLLDPTTLEDLDGGAKAGVATVTSDAVGAATIDASTVYSPDGDSVFHVLVPQGPSVTVLTSCGMPSSSNVIVQLDLQKFRSHDQTTPATLAAGVVSALAFGTDPLAVGTDVPDHSVDDAGLNVTPAVVDPTFVANLTFNNMTPPGLPSGCEMSPPLPSTASHIHVSGTLGGVPVVPLDAVVVQDMADASHWMVSPPGTGADGTGGAWPAGALITITVDTGATDNFNRPLATEASVSFMVKS
jgi:hypothetical protein